MKLLVTIGVWLTGFILLGVLFFGPGEASRNREAVHEIAVKASKAAQDGDWETADDLYEEAVANMPHEYMYDLYNLKVQAAKAKAVNGDMLTAIDDMHGILESMPEDLRHGRLARDVRDLLARNQYYTAWIMRLEGAPRQSWIVFADRSRQQYRILSEQLSEKKQSHKNHFDYNLEGVVKLTRMDLATLRSMPLPAEAKRGALQGVGEPKKKRKKKKGMGMRKEGTKVGEEKPKDVRRDGKMAGERPESFGS